MPFRSGWNGRDTTSLQFDRIGLDQCPLDRHVYSGFPALLGDRALRPQVAGDETGKEGSQAREEEAEGGSEGD